MTEAGIRDVMAERDRLREALQAILEVPFDFKRSAYADAADIAKAALDG